MLNVLSGFISDKERIVTIEDAAELMLRQRHVVRLETRPANIEGKGAIKQRDLVINALRMRPDRIILGEVRGEEAVDMLQSMNTGHDGGLTTIHANTRARRAASSRHDGGDGEPEPAGSRDPPADRVGDSPARPCLAPCRRPPRGHRRHRDHRHGRRRPDDAGHLRLRAGWHRRRRTGPRTVPRDRHPARSAPTRSPHRAGRCRPTCSSTSAQSRRHGPARC